MPSPSFTRRPLFAVVVRSADGTFGGEAIAEAGLTKEAAERAAERLNVLGDVLTARVRKMRWRLVGPGALR